MEILLLIKICDKGNANVGTGKEYSCKLTSKVQNDKPVTVLSSPQLDEQKHFSVKSALFQNKCLSLHSYREGPDEEIEFIYVVRKITANKNMTTRI